MNKEKNESIEFDDDDQMIYDPSKEADRISAFPTEIPITLAKNNGVVYRYAYYFDFRKLQGEWGDTTLANEMRRKYIERLRRPRPEDEKIVKTLIKNAVDKYVARMGVPGILIPIASKSKLNGWICDAFKEHDANIIEYKDSLIKNLNKYVELKNAAKTPEIAKIQHSYLTKKYGDNEFKISKMAGRLRGYFKNFLISNPNFIEDLKSIKGNEVLLIDDSINVGATFHDAIREIKKYKPSKINAFIFLKEAVR